MAFLAVAPAIEALLKADDKLRWVIKDLPIPGKESWLGTKAALATHKQGRHADFPTALMQAENVARATVDALSINGVPVGVNASKQIGMGYP